MKRALLPALLLFAACSVDVPSGGEVRLEPLPLAIVDGAGAGDLPVVLRKDLDARDPDGRLDWSGSPEMTIALHRVDDPALIAGAFRIEGAAGRYAVRATDALGLQYGAYEILERAGILFLHPEETYFPPALCVACVGTVDETFSPTYSMRGTHVHTMHPIEYESTLLGHDPAVLERFDRFLGWLIARRQNYLEWNLLRTVDDERWIIHASEMVSRAHARGFAMGIVAPIAFRQQNSFFLVDGENPAPATEQIAASVDWLMQAGWDRINVEMGASEFFPVSDVEQVELLEFLADYLDEAWPGVRAATKVHCTVNQKAPSFGDMNFNYIPQFADGNVGVMPHSVQWYDLYRTGPTYDREDFTDMREFLLQEIGKREVFYYPETAYWVTFDNDIPLFLPQYVYARWLDLYNLRDSGMDGQINFSSGFEWGYWLNDLAAAWHVYAPDADYLAPVRRVFSMFGSAADDAVAAFDAHTRWQGDELLEKNGIRWLIAWDAADDIGHFADIHAQPIRVRLYEVAKMDLAAAEAFAAAELPQLDGIVEESEGHAQRWATLGDRIPAPPRRIHREFLLGLQMNAIRARFMRSLYDVVLAGVRGDDLAWARALARAESLRDRGIALAARQAGTYRFPLDELAVDRESFTSYPFGYLRTVPDLWYWGRELEMARDPQGYNFLVALYDLIESAGL